MLKVSEYTSCCSYQVAVLMHICVLLKNCQSTIRSIMVTMSLNQTLASARFTRKHLGCLLPSSTLVHGAIGDHQLEVCINQHN